MKDPKDLSTSDLLLPPKLGRPRSGNALSNSQKQKAYRQRAKDSGKRHLLLDSFESGLIESMLSRHIVEIGPDDSMWPTYVEIRRKVQQLL